MLCYVYKWCYFCSEVVYFFLPSSLAILHLANNYSDRYPAVGN